MPSTPRHVREGESTLYSSRWGAAWPNPCTFIYSCVCLCLCSCFECATSKLEDAVRGGTRRIPGCLTNVFLSECGAHKTLTIESIPHHGQSLNRRVVFDASPCYRSGGWELGSRSHREVISSVGTVAAGLVHSDTARLHPAPRFPSPLTQPSLASNPANPSDGLRRPPPTWSSSKGSLLPF